MTHKRLLTACFLTVLSLAVLTGCDKKEEDADNTTPAATTEATTEAVTTEEASTDTTTEEASTEEEISDVVDEDANGEEEESQPTTATKEDEKNVMTATGTFNGLADSNSCEVTLDNGKYMVLLIEDEDLLDTLSEMEPDTKITFTYSPMEGQANYKILSIEESQANDFPYNSWKGSLSTFPTVMEKTKRIDSGMIQITFIVLKIPDSFLFLSQKYELHFHQR